MQVINRQKELVMFDASRIKKMVDAACQELDVDSKSLCLDLDRYIVNQQTTTQEIQNLLIDLALKKADSPQNSQWTLVAGRLNMLDLLKQIDAERSQYTKANFLHYIKYQVDRKNYKNILDFYSTSEIKEISSFFIEENNFLFDNAGVNMLRERYLLHHEKPQEMFMLCAMWLSYTVESSKSKLQQVKQYYEALSSLKLSLATPFLANLRTNTPNLSSCFITAVDDTLESIMQVVTDAAAISKKGGGVGINVSALRAKGSTVNDIANASGGVVPWIKIFNDVALAVSQVKSNRVGAITIALDVWHKDIYDFLDLQTENGDQRRKAFDIFPQVVLPNKFLEAVINDESWYLFDPFLLGKNDIDLVNCSNSTFEARYAHACKSVPKVKTKAKDLFKQIIKVQVETGLPYLFFKDNANAVNPHKQLGTILNGNLCMESYSVFNTKLTHCCNLISLNLARLLDKSTWDYYINLAVCMLNNAFDCTKEPTDNSKKHNQALKTIGLGVMGLADYLAYNKLLYDKDTITPLFASIFDSAVYASACVAEKTNRYKYYNSDFWLCYLKDKVSVRTYDRVKKYGLANGQLMAVAPNTSSSIIGGCTASILPAYDLVFNNKDSKGDNTVAAPFSSTHQWFYATQKNTTQDTIIDVIAGIQNYVDQGISMELIFDLNADNFEAKYIYDTLINAWRKGCKAIYYVRTVQKTLNDCISCAN